MRAEAREAALARRLDLSTAHPVHPLLSSDEGGASLAIETAAGVGIDHMAPLAEVHDSGGYGWTTERRRRYANDRGSDVTLVGVTARSNRQKSDQDPATWMPAPQVHCRYIGEWAATEHRWGLAVDQAEREALLTYAAGCPAANLVFERAG